MNPSQQAGKPNMEASHSSLRARVHLDGRTILAALVTVVVWGSAFAGIRAGLRAYSPTHVALLRYLVASLALAIYALLTRMPLPAWRDLPGLALIGLVGIAFYNVALNYGEVTVPSGTASLLIAAAPIGIALLAILLHGERLQIYGWLGIGLGFVGVTIIAWGTGGGFRFEPRALAILAAAVASALYSVGQKPYLARYSALQCTAYAIWGGTLALLLFSGGLLGELHSAPLASTAAVCYLGVFPGALGYVMWNYTLSRLPASTAGSILYLVPPVAVLVAWAVLGETPTLVALLGGILVVGGVILVNTWGRRRR
jgi:drug/metabolite transporter (DMT)-like permease